MTNPKPKAAKKPKPEAKPKPIKKLSKAAQAKVDAVMSRASKRMKDLHPDVDLFNKRLGVKS